LNVRAPFRFPRLSLTAIALGVLIVAAVSLSGQNNAATLTILSRDARRTIPVTGAGAQEMIALEDLAGIFQVAVREESGALTVSYKGRTIVLTPDQTIASVAGRIISLPAPPTRAGNRWLVPLDFISRALAGIYDQRLELRRPSHLVIVGDLRVPRLTMRQEAVGAGGRVTIDIMPRAASTVTQDGSQRLLVRFDADALDVTLPSPQVPGVIQGYRAVDAATLAIDLGPRATTVHSTTQATDTSSTLVIDLTAAQTDTPTAPPTVTQTEPLPPVVPLTPAELPSLSALGTGIRTIAIDAGHGGDDTGARGTRGTAEKDVTLAIARRLKAAIESRLGTRVVMTRDDDRVLAVTDRTALANNNKADLFISLHANASFRPTVTGATIYVASFAEGAVDPKLLAPERLPAVGGGFRDIELVPWNLAQVRYKDQSEVLASLLADQFRTRIPLAAMPIDRAPLRVLESANMPAILIETGYLSNPDQEKLLASSDFQSLLAQNIVDAIVRYKNGTGSGEGAP
jgi:N-acetylmuramoyl-L-alanine amidase